MSTVYEIVKTLYTFEMPYNGQGNRIKIQTYYECRRHDTLHSPGWNEGKARYETLGKQQTTELKAP